MSGAIYYAIGDIHGEIDSLRALHTAINERHEFDFSGHEKIIVHLGDYVDRGPDSCAVIDYLTGLNDSNHTKYIWLKGNHEQLMEQAYEGFDERAFEIWQDNGGEATLASYHAHGHDAPPDQHLNWIRSLKSIHWDKEAELVFVHAGVDPDYFPNENEQIRMWTRAGAFFDPRCWTSLALKNMRVIHGHTPTANNRPDLTEDKRRINIDTGACFGGPLTACMLAPGQEPKFLQV